MSLRSVAPLLALLGGRAPGQLVIQYTDRCNASCPQCGMRRSAQFARSTLGVERAKALIDRAAAAGVSSLSLTGGEPLLCLDEVVELLLHAYGAGIPYLRTGTNGFLFADPDAPDFQRRVETLAAKLAATRLYTFWISLDSADPARHEEMRGLPGVVRGIERALPILHGYGIYPAANLGINRNLGRSRLAPGFGDEECRQAFADFYEFAAGLGFTMANACYPMSAEGDPALAPVYAATADADLVRFSARERSTLYRSLAEVIPAYRDRLRIFTPRCSLHALAGRHAGHDASYPCRGGDDFFFADARSGNLYPCGYLGGEPLPGFPGETAAGSRSVRGCRLCDWECFRDPSELLGPVLELRSSPFKFLRRALRDPHFFRLWREDLAYYRACGYFHGRRAPDYLRLKPFAAR